MPVVPNTIPNAEDLIKHCWDISEETRTITNTELNREGNLETAFMSRRRDYQTCICVN